jgi:fibronectin type 3 domain-containing protein
MNSRSIGKSKKPLAIKSGLAIGLTVLILILALGNAVAAPLDSKTNVITSAVRKSTNVSYSTYNDWVSTSIFIDSYPAYYTPAEVWVKWNVDSDAVGEVEYKLHYESLDGLYVWESPVTDCWMDQTGNDAADGYAQTSEASLPYRESLNGQFNDLPMDIPMNGTWTFYIRDGTNNSSNRGRIDWWEIRFVYFNPPTGVTASDGTDTSVTVTWNSIPLELKFDHYRVYRATSPGGAKTFVTQLAPGSISPTYSIEDTGITAYRTYYYFVRSCSEYGCAWFSSSDSGYGMLLPPPISASDGAYTDKVRVTFTEDPDAQYYQAWRATSAGGPYTLLGNTPDYDEIYDDTTATSGVTYYYKGKSCNTYGCSDLSYFWDYGMASSEPPTVQASDGDFWYVKLTWDSMPGAHTYRVYRSTTTTPPDPGDYLKKDIYQVPFPAPEPPDPPVLQTWLDYGADPYTTYYYWVVSCLEPTCGPLDEYDAGWRKYRQPHNVDASDGTYTSKVEINWETIDAVTSFKVYRSDSSGGEKTFLGSTPGLSFDDYLATPGVTYYYWIKGCDSTNCSDYSGSNTGWRAWVTPANVLASDGTSTAWVEVNWDSVPGATGYQIFRCSGTGTGSCGAAVGTPTSSPYNDTGASPGVDYYYRVKACAGASNCSDFSDYDAGWRIPAAPVNVQASDGAFTDKIQIMWETVPGATFYKLYRYIASTGTPNLIASPSATTYNDTAPAPGRTYWYWVKACGTNHCGEFSENNDGWRSIIAPGNVQASDGTHLDKVAITWDEVGVAASYRVNRADSETGTKTQIGSPTTESFDDTTALPGKTYYYWITSCAWSKCGGYSAYDTGWRFGYLIYLPLIMR